MASFEQSSLRQKEYLVVKESGQITKIVFPSSIQVGLTNAGFNNGIILPNLSSAPSVIENTLYAVNGNVYFNGVLIGAAGGANITVKDEGSTLVTTLSSLNFTGAGVSASAVGNDVTVQVTSVPGGSDTYVQFNDGGTTFGGDSGLTYNKTTDSLTVAGDVAVNGGDLTSTATTFNLLNSAVTTLNIGAGATTSLNIGASSADVVVAGDLKVGGNDIKASDGNTNITLTSNTLTTTAGDLKVGGNDIQASDGTTAITMAASTGNVTLPADLAVNGGDLTSTATTFNLLNSSVTTLNVGGAVTTINAGSSTAVATIGKSELGTYTDGASAYFSHKDATVATGYAIFQADPAGTKNTWINAPTGGRVYIANNDNAVAYLDDNEIALTGKSGVDQTVTLGSTTGASSLNLQAGTGGIILTPNTVISGSLIVTGSFYSYSWDENLILASQVFG